MYGEYAVRFMIAEAICRFVGKINFNTAQFPKLTEVVDEVIEEFKNEDK